MITKDLPPYGVANPSRSLNLASVFALLPLIGAAGPGNRGVRSRPGASWGGCCTRASAAESAAGGAARAERAKMASRGGPRYCNGRLGDLPGSCCDSDGVGPAELDRIAARRKGPRWTRPERKQVDRTALRVVRSAPPFLPTARRSPYSCWTSRPA